MMSREMQNASILQHGVLAGELREVEGGVWVFGYIDGYEGPGVSLTMPVRKEPYVFSGFPPFLEGLLPEGAKLEAILRKHKIDRSDCFRQLMVGGHNFVGSLTVEPWTDKEGGVV